MAGAIYRVREDRIWTELKERAPDLLDADRDNLLLEYERDGIGTLRGISGCPVRLALALLDAMPQPEVPPAPSLPPAATANYRSVAAAATSMARAPQARAVALLEVEPAEDGSGGAVGHAGASAGDDRDARFRALAAAGMLAMAAMLRERR